MDDLRWQTYDGAANLAGCLNGVAARILSENPRALYVHCANHSLDLALKDCEKACKMICGTLDLVQDLAVFIRSSPTRMAQYQHIASDLGEKLDSSTNIQNPHLLCPTRWTVRTKAIFAIINNYQALYTTIVSIAKEAAVTSVRSTAAGLATKLEKFSTYLGLQFAINIFSVCEQVAIALQKPSVTAQTTITCINALKDNLQDQRSSFGQFYKQVVAASKLSGIIHDPVLPRQTIVPGRLQHGNGEQHRFRTAEDSHRVQYVEAIDTCLASLDERFDQEAFSVLSKIETVLIAAANGLDFDHRNIEKLKGLYRVDIDFEQLHGALKLLKGIIKQRLPEVKKVTSVDTITSLFCSDEAMVQMNLVLSNVLQLLQIYLLAPMSAASGERTFSSQRRVKTYLRSTMTEVRYNNLMILHINKDRTDKINLNLIAKQFIQKNERRIKFFGKF